jgi:hypothetical protein
MLRLYGFGEGTVAYEIFRLERLTDPDEYCRVASTELFRWAKRFDLLPTGETEPPPR